MKPTNIAIAVVAVLVVGAAAWYFLKPTTAVAPSLDKTTPVDNTISSSDMGNYAYECDEHVTFTMTLSKDTNTIKLVSNGSYPPPVTLTRVAATSGAKYTAEGLVMTAHGETVTLGEGDSAINCSPVPNQTEAPFNFGN